MSIRRRLAGGSPSKGLGSVGEANPTPTLTTRIRPALIGATNIGGAGRVGESESLSPTPVAGASKSSVSIKKSDLAYMLTWDPSKKKAPAPVPAVTKGGPQLTKVEENDEDDEDDSGGNAAALPPTPPVPRRRRKEELAKKCLKEVAPSVAPSEIVKSSSIGSDGSGTSTTSDDTSAFLPLTLPANLFHINGNPYAKLDVIGRGGSCKVYRALTKELGVVALKRVKLDGMDKKSIDGYANEIALLKSLQGNPAIIEMYDSEVDLEKKTILIAMQIGDVDLNDVLKQQKEASRDELHTVSGVRAKRARAKRAHASPTASDQRVLVPNPPITKRCSALVKTSVLQAPPPSLRPPCSHSVLPRAG